MIAGRLEYKVELFRPTTTESTDGSTVRDWEPSATVRAERVSMRNSRSVDADEIFTAYSATWRIRSAHEVAEGWRLRQLGCEMVYEVTAIEPNRHKGFLTLYTTRVNE